MDNCRRIDRLTRLNAVECGFGSKDAESKATDDDSTSQICQKRNCRKLWAAYLTLLLLSLLSLGLYCMSVAALTCRLLDNASRQANGSFSPAQWNSQGDACKIQRVRPFSDLWRAETATILSVNLLATALLIQSLMLLPNVALCCDCCCCCTCGGSVGGADGSSGGSGSDIGAGVVRSKIRDPSVNIPVQLDTGLRLTYKTRCFDDVIIRVQIPTRAVPLPDCMKGKRTYELLGGLQGKQEVQASMAGRRRSSAGGGGVGATKRQSMVLTPSGLLELDDEAAAAAAAAATMERRAGHRDSVP